MARILCLLCVSLFAPLLAKAQISLLSPPIKEVVTITPGRTELDLTETGSSVDIIDKKKIENSPARTIDDILGQLPGFNLLRRSSSLVAHPTTQGVSLRGLNTNGASRTLVLLDGIPLNDPFGGWIYWQRLNKNSIEQIEVVPGGSSDLYGNGAISGVIQFITHKPTASNLILDTNLANHATTNLSLQATHKVGNLGMAFNSDLFSTQGYYLIAPHQRGKIDQPARSRHGSFDLHFTFDFNPNLSTTLRLGSFSEDRTNGTILQRNHTETRSFATSLRWRASEDTLFSGNIYGATQLFTSTFSSLSLDREHESLTRSQRVASHNIGFSAQLAHTLTSRHRLLAGIDAHNVNGTNSEETFLPNLPNPTMVTGGSQHTLGLFLQDRLKLKSGMFLILGSQISQIKNDAGKNAHIERVINPKIGLSLRLGERLIARGSLYQAFRAATLNELYRPFRMGNVLTLANSRLSSERFTASEVGLDIFPLANLRLALTAYSGKLTNPVANITLQNRSDLIIRERQNLGAIRNSGVEMRMEYRIKSQWLINLAYLYNQSRITSFSANPLLVGKRVPQSAKHQATLSASYLSPQLGTFTLQLKSADKQFEDDQNRFSLPGYGRWDLGYRRNFAKRLALFLHIENLFNHRIITGRTTVESLAAPRLYTLGLTINL